jgi:hypothetical protein
MLKYALLASLAFATAAHAQQASSTFLIEPSKSAAEARSAAQASALGCGGGCMWWPTYALTDGRGVVEIMASDPYGASTTNKIGAAGLSDAEQAALVPYSTITPLLPAGN